MLHEWIENLSDFEAVLSCTNVLETWDKAAILRAFQIYQWKDASTPGNDSSLVHIENGTIIRYDGAVIAIEYGDIVDALPDLFLALHSIGWRSADLYSQLETRSGLLADIGRSIPANLDLDVRAAISDKNPVNFSEGADMIARGRDLLAGKGGADDNILLEELKSMSPENTSEKFHQTSILLQDDDTSSAVGANASDDIAYVQVSGAESPDPTARGQLDEFDEQPVIFSLPSETKGGGAPQNFDIASTRLMPGKYSMNAIQIEELSNESDAPLVTLSKEPQEESQYNRVLYPVVPEAANYTTELSAPHIIKVGQNAFVFDTLMSPVSNLMLKNIMDEPDNHFTEVVHLHPGALDSAIRWDLMDEVTPKFPSIAENIANTMFGSDNTAINACFLVTVKANRLDAQLRDTLSDEFDKWYLTHSEKLLSVWPDAGAIISGDVCGSYEENVVKSFYRMKYRTQGLAISTRGSAFVDVRNSDDQRQFDTFSVRSIAENGAANLYAIHMDSLDGPFVFWIADILKTIASAYAATKRDSFISTAVGFKTKLVDEAELARQSQLVCGLDAMIEQATEVVDNLRTLKQIARPNEYANPNE